MDRPSITAEAIQDMANSAAELYILILDLSEVPALTPEALQNLIFRLRDIFEDLDEVITATLGDNGAVLEIWIGIKW